MQLPAQYKEINGIRVYSELQEVPISEINLNNWNPNFVPSNIEKAIEDDIKKNGFLRPIILQKRNKKLKKDNVIIDGQHRFEIFSRLIKENLNNTNEKDLKIPAIIIDCHDKTAMALTVRLNREHGDLMPDKIGLIARDLSPSFDIDYLNDILYIPKEEITLLADISDKIGEVDKDLMEDSKDFLKRTQDTKQNNDSNDTNDANSTPSTMQGIPSIQCPKCKTHIMLPSNQSSSIAKA